MMFTFESTFNVPVIIAYPIGILAVISLMIWLLSEYGEFQTRSECIRRSIPYVRVPSMTISHILGKSFDLAELDLTEKHGSVYGCTMFNEFTIGIGDAELAQIICNKEFTKFTNRRQMKGYDIIWDSFLFAANDDDWKRLRAIVSPTFSSGKLRKVKHCIDDTIRTMIKHFNKNIENDFNDQVVDIKQVVGGFVMDTIIQMAYGVKIDSIMEPDNPIIKNAQQVFGVDMGWKDSLFVFFSTACPIMNKIFGIRFKDESLRYFEKISLEIIQKKREEFKHKQGKASNFIELILEVEHEQEKTNSTNQFKYITNDEIISQCVTFFIVGYDTTTTNIVNACYLLATNPEIQVKLYESIERTIQELQQENPSITDPFELITFESINRFEYLSAFLNETLRYISIGTVFERQASEDVRLETADHRLQVNIKKGDIVRVNIAKLHQDPNNFFEPERFLPERFLPDTPESKTTNKQAFIPFGSGPRGCIAKYLALLEAKMALIHLCRLFRFEVHPKRTEKKLEFYLNVDTNITKDCHLRVVKRS